MLDHEVAMSFGVCLKHYWLIMNLTGKSMADARPAVDSRRLERQDLSGSSS